MPTSKMFGIFTMIRPRRHVGLFSAYQHQLPDVSHNHNTAGATAGLCHKRQNPHHIQTPEAAKELISGRGTEGKRPVSQWGHRSGESYLVSTFLFQKQVYALVVILPDYCSVWGI